MLLNLAVLRGHFWPFWGSKKSISRFFQSCLGVALDVFGFCFKPERAYFWVYLDLQRSLNDLKNQDLGSQICSFWPI